MRWFKLIILCLFMIQMVNAKPIPIIESENGVLGISPNLWRPIVSLVSERYSFGIGLKTYFYTKQGVKTYINLSQTVFFDKITNTGTKFNFSIKNTRNINKVGIEFLNLNNIPMHMKNESVLVIDDKSPAMWIDFSDIYGQYDFILNTERFELNLDNVDEINIDPSIDIVNFAVVGVTADIIDTNKFVYAFIDNAGDECYMQWKYTNGTNISSLCTVATNLCTQSVSYEGENTIQVKAINNTHALFVFIDKANTDLTYSIWNRSCTQTKSDADIDTSTGSNPTLTCTSNTDKIVSCLYHDYLDNATYIYRVNVTNTTMVQGKKIDGYGNFTGGTKFKTMMYSLNSTVSILGYYINSSGILGYKIIKYDINTFLNQSVNISILYNNNQWGITGSRYNDTTMSIYFTNWTGDINSTLLNTNTMQVSSSRITVNDFRGTTNSHAMYSSNMGTNRNGLLFINTTPNYIYFRNVSEGIFYNLSTIASINSTTSVIPQILANNSLNRAFCDNGMIFLYVPNKSSSLMMDIRYYNLSDWSGNCYVLGPVCQCTSPNDWGVDWIINSSCICSVQNVSFANKIHLKGSLWVNGTLNISNIFYNSTNSAIYINSTGKIYMNRS